MYYVNTYYDVIDIFITIDLQFRRNCAFFFYMCNKWRHVQ